MRRLVHIALGANIDGSWGSPEHSVLRAVDLIGEFVADLQASRLFRTSPVGAVPQPSFVNAVVRGLTDLPPEPLLAELKRLERAAGRQPGVRWGPRPLDLDILDMEGVVTGWEGQHRAPQDRTITLPHPEMHKRAFVLVPLADISPAWQHPTLQLPLQALLAALPDVSDVTPIEPPAPG